MHFSHRPILAWIVPAFGILLSAGAIALALSAGGSDIQGFLAPAAWTVLVLGISLICQRGIREARIPAGRWLSIGLGAMVLGALLILQVDRAPLPLGLKVVIDLGLIALIVWYYPRSVVSWNSVAPQSAQRTQTAGRWRWTGIGIILAGAVLGPVAEIGLAASGLQMGPAGSVGMAISFTALFAGLWPFLLASNPQICEQLRLDRVLLISLPGALVSGLAYSLSLAAGLSFWMTLPVVFGAALAGSLLTRLLMRSLSLWLRR